MVVLRAWSASGPGHTRAGPGAALRVHDSRTHCASTAARSRRPCAPTRAGSASPIPAEIDKWGIVGLLHDFDYEQNPTEDTHLHVGGPILRERGYPEEIVEAICSHADYMNIPRDTPLKKAIYACDELVGFIGALREGPALQDGSRTCPSTRS